VSLVTLRQTADRHYVNAMALYALGDALPVIDDTAFIHPDAVIIGRVEIGPESSVWPGAVLRGDTNVITVGANTSIQDGTVVHCTEELATHIGARCVIGHNVHMEGCTVSDDALLGSGSVVLHRAVVESWALVGAQALVPNSMVVPSRAMALGVPAKLRLDCVTDDMIQKGVATYTNNARTYPTAMRRIG
jgi:carbonic anhydrase/acetyltransferase-like protein (isoleucine patch superfamily)